MLLLAVDTSGKHSSVALARCGPQEDCEVIEVTALTGGTFSAELVPQIAALLDRHGFSKEDIGAFAAVSGPGSFTGLRIGLAVIKGLGEAFAKPIAAVSLLEAVAGLSRLQGKVVAALEAGRNEVFLGEYEVGSGGTRLIRERLLNRNDWVHSAGDPVMVTPDTTIAAAARANGFQVIEVERPRSDAIAQLGWKKIACGEIVSAETLEASYIGRSESELFVKGGS